MWNYVTPHFSKFLNDLELGALERADALGKAERAARKLFSVWYPGAEFDPRCYAIVGSYGKGTAAKPTTDVDMIFVLPDAQFARFEARASQKQSALLQEIKADLIDRFPTTDIRGDGPVVKVPFSTYDFEVCPVFRLQDGSFINAHTKDGGRWGHTNPAAEMNWLKAVDGRSLQKATQLVKMLKAWKCECNVEVRSICLETLAILFVQQWQYADQPTLLWHDWMLRDFFSFAHQYAKNGWIQPAGITEQIPVGDWQPKCLLAYSHALRACQHERADEGTLATNEWRKIFGDRFKGTQRISSLQTLSAMTLLTGLRV